MRFLTVPISCSVDSNCVSGFVCKDNLCHPQCAADNDCAFNEKCLKGNCILTCRVDNDCFLGHICLHNMCIFGCHHDDDCTGSESCRSNNCVDPCAENPCGPNAQCTVSNHRATCSCGTSFVANPTPKIGCVRAPPQQCTQNRDCNPGTTCIDQSCRTLCSSDAGCFNNERCDVGTGVCKPICRRDDDCKNGEICEGLACTVGCRSDSGCSSEKKCLANQCVDVCASPTACGTNAECAVVNHNKLCSCPQPLVGNPLEYCRYPVQPCAADGECVSGHVCYQALCQQMCRS